jgi:GDP-mannose pyrophosphatase NudK
MSRVKIKSKEVVSNEHALLQKISYTLENGKDNSEQVREVYDHGDAVAVLLYNNDKRKFLFTRQFRLPTFLNGNSSGELLEVCAGLVEENESPENTLKREILEETGFKVDALEKIYEAYSSAGVLTELLHLFIAPYTDDQKEEEGGGLKEEGENIKLLEMDYDEAMAMLNRGEIRDAKTIILLQFFALKKIGNNEQH